MTKGRLVITALFVEGQTPSEIARRYGVHRAWVYKLKARYEAEGATAFEPRSRRPKTSPAATPTTTVELVLRIRTELTAAGHDAGADTIGWHLKHHHQLTVTLDNTGECFEESGSVLVGRGVRVRREAPLTSELILIERLG